MQPLNWPFFPLPIWPFETLKTHKLLQHTVYLDAKIQDLYLRVPWSKQTPIIYIGWSNQRNAIVYYHQFAMNINLDEEVTYINIVSLHIFPQVACPKGILSYVRSLSVRFLQSVELEEQMKLEYSVVLPLWSSFIWQWHRRMQDHRRWSQFVWWVQQGIKYMLCEALPISRGYP